MLSTLDVSRDFLVTGRQLVQAIHEAFQTKVRKTPHITALKLRLIAFLTPKSLF